MPHKLPALSFDGLSADDLERVMKYGRSSDTLGGYRSQKFVELPYGIIRKDLPTLQKKALHLDYVVLILGCQHGDLDLSGVTANEIMAFMLWIKEQQDHIYKLEKAYLSSEPEAEMIAAGVHRLDEMGALSTIHSLAQGDILRHPAIEALPYYKVYEVLKLEKINRDIQKAHTKIMADKNKK